MHELKRLDPAAIPRALQKAERYRLLNEPREAESICRDILDADPAGRHGGEGATALLILAITDQFSGAAAPNHAGPERAFPLVAQLASPYDRAYLSGVICERWAKAELARSAGGTPGHVIHDWLAQAMAHFEQAESLAPAGNDDAVLRWNSCVRILQRHPELRPRAEDTEKLSDLADV